MTGPFPWPLVTYDSGGGTAISSNPQLVNGTGELDKPITQGVICVCYDWREPHVHVMNKQELKAKAIEFLERYEAYCSLVNASFPKAIPVAV